MTYTSSQLLGLSQQELDDLFSSSPAGDIPNGEGNGTAIIAPGTVFSADDRVADQYSSAGRERPSTPLTGP
jgi:hypothetical protein